MTRFAAHTALFGNDTICETIRDFAEDDSDDDLPGFPGPVEVEAPDLSNFSDESGDESESIGVDVILESAELQLLNARYASVLTMRYLI